MAKTKKYSIPTDFKNDNWLQSLRIKDKKFDDSIRVIFDGVVCVAYFFNERIVDCIGDKVLSDIIKQYFRQSLKTRVGEKLKEGQIFTERLVKLAPGDDGYVSAVVLDKLQNELGMQVDFN